MHAHASNDVLRERALFESLLPPGGEAVAPGVLEEALRRAGLRADDPRLARSLELIDELGDEAGLDEAAFRRVISPAALLFDRTLSGQLVVPDFQGFAADLQGLFEQARDNTSGDVASYIPTLAGADPERFGLSMCTIDGQRASFGDATTPFSAQCTHKPITYAMALEDRGETFVHRHMGCEPSGQSFNEITLNGARKPHNPMLNSGSIMCGALIRQDLDLSARLEHAIGVWHRLSGGRRPGFDMTSYLSERKTADRNFALAYFMREHGAFPLGADMMDALEFYLQCCSLEVDAELLSVVAATLAAGGVCPLSGERVFRPDTVQKCLSFMSTCGMYDFSGEWSFRIGMPAKSGVSGAVMVVVPGVAGFCLWSPRLDSHGNSIRAIDFCERLVDRFNFHPFDDVAAGAHRKVDPRFRRRQSEREMLIELCWAASEGDLNGVRRLVARGVDLDSADYDGRTAIHLAASEGRDQVVAFLLERGVKPDPVDRWGGIPLDDAVRGGHERVAEMLAMRSASSTEAA